MSGQLKRMTDHARRGNADTVVEIGERLLAKASDPASVREVADRLGRMRKIVAAATQKNSEINKIGKIWLKAIRKGGGLLREMAEKGERAAQGKPPAVGGLANLKDMGFTYNRASRWQLAESLPLEIWETFIREAEAKDDSVLTFADILTLAKHLEREKDLAAQRLAIERGEFVVGKGPYDVIVYDPPWPYGTEYDPNSRRVGSPYPEMSLEEIEQDGMKEIVRKMADDCILWLWTTHKFMRTSFPLLDAWDFEEKVILTWVKDKIGTGAWLRSKSEFCILAIRGKPKVQLTGQSTIISGAMREHSRKPDEFFEMLEELCIGVRRYDRFGREARQGWDVGGNTPHLFDEVAQ